MNKAFDIKYYCKCGNEICSKNAVYGSGLCKSCIQTGSKNHQHIDGRKKKQHYCTCGNKISYTTYLVNGKCRSCMGKSYRLPKIICYCKDCKIELNQSACYSNTKRCHSCAKKEQFRLHPETNHFFGKTGKLSAVFGTHPSEETRKLMSLAKGGTGIPYEDREYPLEFYDIREFIRNRDNHECQICHKKEENLFRKLDIHHIDYDKQNCQEENLISLCISCHLKTTIDRDYYYAYFLYKNQALIPSV